MNAHFIDIDTLVQFDSKIWIIDRFKPNEPLVKIDKTEFKLIRKGVYKSNNNRIVFRGVDYFLSDQTFNNIKVYAKNSNVDISNITFSMQEFMSSELIEKNEYRLELHNIHHLRNTKDQVYVLCTSNSSDVYLPILKVLEKELAELGINMRVLQISDTFYDRDEDMIVNKTIYKILSYLFGYKIEAGKFSEKINIQYDKLHFYNNDNFVINKILNINNVFKMVYNSSELEVKNQIKTMDKSVEVNLVSNNKVNLFKTVNIDLTLNKVLKTFESFIQKK